MKIEIRQEIREYILSDVNMMLARLGVSESAYLTVERVDKYNDTMLYDFVTPSVKQFPVMFKKTYIDGYMVAIEIKDEKDRYYEWSKENDIIVVWLYLRWESFRGGSNGTELGRVIYSVSKDLPKEFKIWAGHDSRENYVRKLEGLEL